MIPDKICLIGAGQASAWAAYTLRTNGYAGRISVISNELEVFYERPPLSKEYLGGQKTLEDLAIFPKKVIEELDLEWYIEDTVINIDTYNKIAVLKSGTTLAYDYTLLATGSCARIPVDEWKNMEHVYTLRNITDTSKLNQQLLPGKKLVIVGGGWIGLEIAATVKQKGVSVIVLELASMLCGRGTSVELSNFLKEMHETHNNQIIFNNEFIRLAETNDKHIEVYNNDQLITVTDLVVVGAGAQLNTELAKKICLEMQNGAVKVNHRCQTSDQCIYAAGDVAIHPDLGFSIQSYQNAQNQGTVAAKNMLGIDCSYHDIPWIWSDQFDNNIQLLGIPLKSGMKCIERIISERQKSYFYFMDHRLQFVFSINDPKSIKLAKKWMHTDIILPIEDIKNPDFDLMSLKI